MYILYVYFDHHAGDDGVLIIHLIGDEYPVNTNTPARGGVFVFHHQRRGW